jgi:3-oxoacyl-[acyl-carrier protein] reductase
METIVPRSYVLVTGGAGGIGSAICNLLPVVGFIPIVGFNTSDIQARKLASELGGFALKIDMSNNKSVREAISFISNNLQETDSLVGVILGASPPPDLLPFASTTADQLSNQLQVNVIGPQILLAALIKNFFRKAKSGTVVGILSKAMGTSITPPTTGMSAYVIAKSALNCMLSICANEYPWLKVRTVSPGFTKTRMLDVFDSRYLVMAQAQNVFSSPEEIAQLILEEFLS